MKDQKYPKILLYGELRESARNVGGQKLRYKATLKRNLKMADVRVEDWEEVARDSKEWKKLVHNSAEVVENKRAEEYMNRHRARHGLVQSAITCNRGRRNFLSNAGLASHTRANKW